MGSQEPIMYNIRYHDVEGITFLNDNHAVVGYIYGEGVPATRHPRFEAPPIEVAPEDSSWHLQFTNEDTGIIAAGRLKSALRDVKKYSGRKVLVFSEPPKNPYFGDREVPRDRLQGIVKTLIQRIPELTFELKEQSRSI
jgi:hypothetical protein